jgi:hypothetical protein
MTSLNEEETAFALKAVLPIWTMAQRSPWHDFAQCGFRAFPTVDLRHCLGKGNLTMLAPRPEPYPLPPGSKAESLSHPWQVEQDIPLTRGIHSLRAIRDSSGKF